MGKLKDKSLKDILGRSSAEKLFAVECIWENLREEALLTEPEKDELDNMEERLKKYKRSSGTAKSWQEIKKTYLKKK